MKNLNDTQALKEAQKRWGKNGIVQRHRPDGVGLTHSVGRVELGMFFAVKGQGRSWEEAFKNAEGR